MAWLIGIDFFNTSTKDLRHFFFSSNQSKTGNVNDRIVSYNLYSNIMSHTKLGDTLLIVIKSSGE